MGTKVGLKKCAVARIVGDKVVQCGSLPLSSGGTIGVKVEYGDMYRKFGDQLFGAKLAKSKQRIVKEYIGRPMKTWGSRLNANNTA